MEEDKYPDNNKILSSPDGSEDEEMDDCVGPNSFQDGR